jgi:HEAT repeat protein
MRAADDGYTRGKFIELLGEMGDTAVVADLIAELTHSDQNVREWAVTALRTIGGEAAERAIQQYEATQPEEFA